MNTVQTAPTRRLAGPRPAAPRLAQPAPQPAPAPPAAETTEAGEEIDVNQMISNIGSGYTSLRANAAAYGALMRIMNPDPTASRQLPPILSWTANFNSEPVGVETDLDLLKGEEREAVISSLVAVHESQMVESLNKIIESAEAMRAVVLQTVNSNTTEQEAPANQG